jgi:hypothetical protein
MRVKLSEPCVLEGQRYEAGDVVEVAENIQELNAGWMEPTADSLTDRSPEIGAAAPDEAPDEKPAKNKNK